MTQSMCGRIISMTSFKYAKAINQPFVLNSNSLSQAKMWNFKIKSTLNLVSSAFIHMYVHVCVYIYVYTHAHIEFIYIFIYNLYIYYS